MSYSSQDSIQTQTAVTAVLSESRHHLTPSNLTTKLTTLPRYNNHHLVTTPHLFCLGGAVVERWTRD